MCVKTVSIGCNVRFKPYDVSRLRYSGYIFVPLSILSNCYCFIEVNPMKLKLREGCPFKEYDASFYIPWKP